MEDQTKEQYSGNYQKKNEIKHGRSLDQNEGKIGYSDRNILFVKKRKYKRKKQKKNTYCPRTSLQGKKDCHMKRRKMDDRHMRTMGGERGRREKEIQMRNFFQFSPTKTTDDALVGQERRNGTELGAM